MNLSRKINQFFDFLLSHKIPKMIHRKSTDKLLELYYENSPKYYQATDIKNHIQGAIVVYAVGEELKRRYPKSIKLQNWDYKEQLDLHKIVGGGVCNGKHNGK